MTTDYVGAAIVKARALMLEALGLERVVLDHLRADPEVRAVVAKMARSEVKGYLADLAEQAEMPFVNAAGFLRGVRAATAGIATTNLADDEPADGCDCTCSNCQGCLSDDDYNPQIETLPSGHTTMLGWWCFLT